MSGFSGPGFQEFRERFALGEVNPHCKQVVVAIDFGTSYSGIAFAYKADPASIHYGAPTATDIVQRNVTSSLLQMDDGTWEFGNQAEAKYNEILLNQNPDAPAVPAHLYEGFKMILNGCDCGFDTATVLSFDGKPHPLIDLVTRVLQNLKDFAIRKLCEGWGDTLDLAKDIQWVITVPAFWNDFGKAFMRKAAFKAGLMETEQSDDLMLVLEPECAAVAVFAGPVNYILKPESRFLVLDCGGGTVDITVHELNTNQPLTMKTISIPTGGPWGGDYVNLEFKKFLKELLGPDLYKESEMPCEFYNIYAEFDKVKILFDPQRNPGYIRLVDVLEDRRQLIGLAEKYNAVHPTTPILTAPAMRNGFLLMSKELMLSFFEPSLQPIVDETRKVMAEHRNISYILVVGGFGSSTVLTDRIRSEFHNSDGVRLLLPDISPKPQAAIVLGALYCGLYRDIIQSRIAPYTYGVAMQMNGIKDSFHVLVRKGEVLPHDHEVVLFGMPIGEEKTCISWRLYRSYQQAPTTVTGEHHLGTVTVDCSLHTVQHSHGKHRARFQFGGSEIRVVIENAQRGEYRGEISMV